MRKPRLLLPLLSLLLSGAAQAAVLPFQGRLSLELANYAPLLVPTSGLAVVNGSGGLGTLTSFALPGGSIAGGASIPLTDPAGFPVEGLEYAVGNSQGSFALGGKMALTGHLTICLFGACNASPGGNIVVPFTQNGTRGIGLGGPPIVGQGVVNFTIQAASWTTGVAPVGTWSRTGFVHGPASGGASSAAAVSGAIRLVTPTALQTNIGITGPVPIFAVLDVRFVPEPGSLALLASGLAGLALDGRRRMRGTRAARSITASISSREAMWRALPRS